MKPSIQTNKKLTTKTNTKPKTKPKPQTQEKTPTDSRVQQMKKKKEGLQKLEAQKWIHRELEGDTKQSAPKNTHHSLKLSREAAATTQRCALDRDVRGQGVDTDPQPPRCPIHLIPRGDMCDQPGQGQEEADEFLRCYCARFWLLIYLTPGQGNIFCY